MSGSSFGKIFRVTTWGESHGPAVGAVIDGCPAGIPLTENDVQAFLDRRRPGQSKYTTKRQETDSVEILSGVFEGKTTGTPISMIVRNQDQRSRDYGEIAFSYRPGHADYTIRIPRLQRRRPLFRPGNHRQGRSRRRSVAFSPGARHHTAGLYESIGTLLCSRRRVPLLRNTGKQLLYAEQCSRPGGRRICFIADGRM